MINRRFLRRRWGERFALDALAPFDEWTTECKRARHAPIGCVVLGTSCVVMPYVDARCCWLMMC